MEFKVTLCAGIPRPPEAHSKPFKGTALRNKCRDLGGGLSDMTLTDSTSFARTWPGAQTVYILHTQDAHEPQLGQSELT